MVASWNPFQSHAGSIEARGGEGRPLPQRVAFQSHAGSIEARGDRYRSIGVVVAK